MERAQNEGSTGPICTADPACQLGSRPLAEWTFAERFQKLFLRDSASPVGRFHALRARGRPTGEAESVDCRGRGLYQDGDVSAQIYYKSRPGIVVVSQLRRVVAQFDSAGPARGKVDEFVPPT